MAWPMVVAGIAGSVISAKMQSDAQSKAASSYGKTANSQTQAIMDMYNMTRADLSPYMKAGEWGMGYQKKPFTEKLMNYSEWRKDQGISDAEGPQSLPHRNLSRDEFDRYGSGGPPRAPVGDPNRHAYETYVDDYNKRKGEVEYSDQFREGSYLDLIDKGSGEFEEDPGYKFRLGEGNKAIDRASAASGGFFSGKHGKALVEYGQDYATNEFDKFMGRYYKKLDTYGNLATMGQSAAAKVGAAGQTAVGNSANVQLGAAEGRASSYVNKGDIWGGAVEKGSALLSEYGRTSSYGSFPNVETGRMPGHSGYGG